MQDRRMFLQAGAALALPVMGGALIKVRSGVTCTTCDDDPVSAETMRQYKAAIRQFYKSPRGEHARQAAAALRVMAANGRARNLDAEFRTAVEREVSTYGRDNVLMRGFDVEQFAAVAREFGAVPAPALGTITLAERQQALEALLTAGITSHMERAAEFFEAAGAHLDARTPTRRVQTKEEQIKICRDLQTLISTAEAAMIVACLLFSVFACAYFSGYYLGVKLYYDTQTECSRWVG